MCKNTSWYIFTTLIIFKSFRHDVAEAIQNVLIVSINLAGDVFVTHSINVSYPRVGGSQ